MFLLMWSFKLVAGNIPQGENNARAGFFTCDYIAEFHTPNSFVVNEDALDSNSLSPDVARLFNNIM